jgi:hypothetical protein
MPGPSRPVDLHAHDITLRANDRETSES